MYKQTTTSSHAGKQTTTSSHTVKQTTVNSHADERDVDDELQGDDDWASAMGTYHANKAPVPTQKASVTKSKTAHTTAPSLLAQSNNEGRMNDLEAKLDQLTGIICDMAKSVKSPSASTMSLASSSVQGLAFTPTSSASVGSDTSNSPRLSPESERVLAVYKTMKRQNPLPPPVMAGLDHSLSALTGGVMDLPSHSLSPRPIQNFFVMNPSPVPPIPALHAAGFGELPRRRRRPNLPLTDVYGQYFSPFAGYDD